jgi:hypothetical protein
LRKRVIAAALLAAALITTGYIIGQIHGTTPSSAASPRQMQPATGMTLRWGFRDAAGPHAAGQVTAVNGNTITIKPVANHPGEQNTVTTVVLTSSTQYLAPGTTTSPTKDSIKVGSFIVADGTVSADGKTLTASHVVVLPNGAPPAVRKLGPHAEGQVTAINGNTITIKPFTKPNGEQSSVTTIVLTGSTQYAAPGDMSTTKNAIKVGSFVIAQGTLSADGKTLTASRVMVLPSAPPAGGFGVFDVSGPHAAGQVTAINGNTITIKSSVNRAGVAGTVTTIVVTSSTRYATGPEMSATKAAVKVGSYVLARGTLSSDGKTLTATQVVVLPSAPTFGPFHGLGMWRDQFRGFGDAGAQFGPNV